MPIIESNPNSELIELSHEWNSKVYNYRKEAIPISK